MASLSPLSPLSPLSSSLPCLIVPSSASLAGESSERRDSRGSLHALTEGVHVAGRRTGVEFLDSVDVLLFDCDGVLWHGDKLLPGIKKLFDAFAGDGERRAKRASQQIERGTQKKIFFLTNNSTKSRKGFLKKLEALGLHAKEEQIICSSVVAAWYLQERRAQKAKEKEETEKRDKTEKKGKKEGEAPEPDDSLVYVIGEQGLLEELHNHGFKTLGGPSDGEIVLDFQKDKDLAVDFRRDVGTVVVGLDRCFNYYKLQYAQLCINFNGAFFLGTNRDALGNFTPSQVWAGAGAMVQAVEAATGKKAEVAGKPSNILREYLLTHVLGSTPLDRVCLVGDRLDTDIRFAQRLGVRSVLALTGVTDPTLLLRHIQKRQACTQGHAEKGGEDPAGVTGQVPRSTALQRPAGEGLNGQQGEAGRQEKAERDGREPNEGRKRRRSDEGHMADVQDRVPEFDYIVPDFVIATAAHLIE
uniref:HAD hydrolase, family IIA protein n=1 Tax=Neospora caninum (strain Liverpool) TaxID=572307 RepID=A0A0F7U426_NEOCL|nr:TPA: HAD hydrolase, family IIA protein [Neospora caninum Liverpool]